MSVPQPQTLHRSGPSHGCPVRFGRFPFLSFWHYARSIMFPAFRFAVSADAPFRKSSFPLWGPRAEIGFEAAWPGLAQHVAACPATWPSFHRLPGGVGTNGVFTEGPHSSLHVVIFCFGVRTCCHNFDIFCNMLPTFSRESSFVGHVGGPSVKTPFENLSRPRLEAGDPWSGQSSRHLRLSARGLVPRDSEGLDAGWRR